LEYSFVLQIYTFFVSPLDSPPVGHDLLIVEDLRSHSVGLLWMIDQLHAGTYTSQDTIFVEIDTYVTGGIRTRNPNKRAVAELRL